MQPRNTQGQFKTPPVSRGHMTTEETGQQQNEHPHGSPQFGWDGLPAAVAPFFLSIYANGGSPANPMGFPGYGSLYTGSYVNYRWILQHPVVRLVREIAVAPIIGSTWKYEKTRDGVPDAWLNHVREDFDQIRINLLDDFFTDGRDMGWAGGEPIWEIRDGRTRLKRVKPLLQDATEQMLDGKGNFVGLRNYISPRDEDGNYKSDGSVDLPAPFKAWRFVYDGKNNIYGRSWLENIRATAWKDWLDCAQQLQKLGAKLANTVAVIKSPPGTFPGPVDPATGKPKEITYREQALSAITALAAGAPGVWFPSLTLRPDAKGGFDQMKLMAELASKSLINIDVLDFGNHAPAILGLLERMRHDEELMFAGGLRPSRSGMEARNAAKADAEVHTDTGTQNSEGDDTRFAMQLQPLVDADLTINFGDNAAGAVRINPPSLVDRVTAVVKALLLAGMNVPAIATEVFKSVNVDELLKVLSISVLKPFDPGAITIVTPAPGGGENKPPGSPDPQGGRPKAE